MKSREEILADLDRMWTEAGENVEINLELIRHVYFIGYEGGYSAGTIDGFLLAESDAKAQSEGAVNTRTPLGTVEYWGFTIKFTFKPPNIRASIFSRDNKKAVKHFHGKDKIKLLYRARKWVDENKSQGKSYGILREG